MSEEKIRELIMAYQWMRIHGCFSKIEAIKVYNKMIKSFREHGFTVIKTGFYEWEIVKE